MMLNANLTAKRQSSRRLVFTDDFFTCDSYRDPSLALRMTGGRRECKYVTQAPSTGMELGEALRNTENFLAKTRRPYPPSPNGATRWPGFKVFVLCAGYAHIIARLRNPLQDFCLWKGAPALRHAALVTQNQIP